MNNFKAPPKALPVERIYQIERYMFIAFLAVIATAVGTYFLIGNRFLSFSILGMGMISCFGVGMIFSKKAYKDAES